uniref:Uncharacterized protein n=1 Tax=Candidatus Kentrum sp. LPFa TaxID=2126335 RepID=A0A450VM23_9GAMM|nr:MAG: hypothetical protein BECKLPF1236B_GA0070989_100130 [Candidatus Kentron sp. LPFa]
MCITAFLPTGTFTPLGYTGFCPDATEREINELIVLSKIFPVSDYNKRRSCMEGHFSGQPNETTFQLTLTYLRLKYSPSKGHESKFST